MKIKQSYKQYWVRVESLKISKEYRRTWETSKNSSMFILPPANVKKAKQFQYSTKSFTIDWFVFFLRRSFEIQYSTHLGVRSGYRSCDHSAKQEGKRKMTKPFRDLNSTFSSLENQSIIKHVRHIKPTVKRLTNFESQCNVKTPFITEIFSICLLRH